MFAFSAGPLKVCLYQKVTHMTIFDSIRNNQLDTLATLVNSDPKLVNQPDEKGFTPLVLATYVGNKAAAEVLIEHGANINYQDPMMGMTALMGVCFKGSTELTKLLLDKGADASIKNKSGETALDFAKKGGHAAVAELLS